SLVNLLPLLLLLATGNADSQQEEELFGQQVTYLRVGQSHTKNALSMLQSIYTRKWVQIYCRRDQRLRWANIFQSNRLQLQTDDPSAEYAQYKAATVKDVLTAHLEQRECHEGKVLAGQAGQMHSIALSSHAHSCYGIYTDHAYNLTLMQLRCDEHRVARFLLGLAVWATAPLFGDSLLCCYVLATALGVHFAALGVVCVALLSSGDRQLKGLRPLGINFKLVLQQHPSTVALALVAGAWLCLRICKSQQGLWRHQCVRRAHYRLLRLVSYILIFGASDHRSFGYCCLCLLMPWPELWWFMLWSRRQCVKLRRNVMPPKVRQLLSREEYQAQTNF
ncbi:hypothetical protein KR222_003487, partial [Zaprionus bogoriensis]